MNKNDTRTTLDREELRRTLSSGQPVTVLDVRNDADRAEWSIPGSTHVDAYAALKTGDTTPLDNLDLPKDRPVVTICEAGKTSQLAAERLRERGYDAHSLAGGMRAWSLAWNTAEVPIPDTSTTVLQVRRTGKGCLSYLIGSAGEAAVVDAALDPEVFISLAEERGWRITHVLDTHIHADHLSRSRALASHAGAALHLPVQDRVAFPFASLRDGDAITVGRATLSASATPGHTMEAMSYLLDGQALLTGDTLFLNAVGRPDLEASEAESRTRAHLLYRSLKHLTALPGDTLVLPAHTSDPVPFDGEPIAAPLSDVIARVEALRLSEEAFVDRLLARIPPTPPNHAAIVGFNEAGELPDGDLTDLEAGANRCAVS